MNSIACTAGRDATAQMHSAIASSSQTVEVLSPAAKNATVFAGCDSNNVVGVARTDAGGLAALGSGLRRLGTSPDIAARSLLDALTNGEAALLDALPHDAVAIGFAPDGELILACGTGQHRLFHYEHGETFVAASRVGLVADGIHAAASVDRSYEDFLLSYAFLPGSRTLCEGVTALPVETTLRRDGDVTYRSSVSDPPPQVDALAETEDPHDRLYALLLEIVAEQAGDDVDVGVLLGGVDSALVASVLHKLGYRVHTFTFEFEEARYNQRNVELACHGFASNHTWVPITSETIADGLNRYGEIYNQPVAQPHYLFHTLACCEAMQRAGLRQAFSGDGADAAFLGYPTVNQRARLMSTAGRVPRSLRRAASKAASAQPLERLLGHTGRKIRAVLEQAEAEGTARGHLPTPIFDATSRQLLREDDPPQLESTDAIRARLAEGLDDVDLARVALHGHALIGQSRTKVDGAVPATGVAMHSPYLDQRLRSFAAGLDPNVLRTPASRAGDLGKQLLLETAERFQLLPPEVIFQPKQSPVDAPIDEWYAGPLRANVLGMLDSLPFAWDRAYVNRLLNGGHVDRWYRNRVARLGHHILQPVGLLCSYAACSKRIAHP